MVYLPLFIDLSTSFSSSITEQIVSRVFKIPIKAIDLSSPESDSTDSMTLAKVCAYIADGQILLMMQRNTDHRLLQNKLPKLRKKKHFTPKSNLPFHLILIYMMCHESKLHFVTSTSNLSISYHTKLFAINNKIKEKFRYKFEQENDNYFIHPSCLQGRQMENQFTYLIPG